MKNMTRTARAVLYARVVTDSDNTKEINAQCIKCEHYIKERGYELVTSYIDEGASGSSLNRPAMDRLRADAAAGKFDRVVVVDLTRIARNRRALEQFIYEMQSQVIFIDCVKEMIEL